MFTSPEIKLLMNMIDASLRAVGVQVAQDGGMAKLDSILTKLQANEDANNREAESGPREVKPGKAA